MKFLTFRDDVKKTPAINRAAELMDKFFDKEPSEITSGLRTPQDQMNLLFEKGRKHDLVNLFPEADANRSNGVEFTVHIQELNRDLFYWQRLWSKLLNIGEIINPPVAAECLFDYFNDGRNKKGEVIQLSNHQRGMALDVGGGKNLLAKAECVMRALQSGECFIRQPNGFRIEHINNAVHVDVLQIG